MSKESSRPYILGSDHQDKIDTIFENLNQKKVADNLKKSLQEFCDEALDEVIDYMKDEYVLRIEEIALAKANQIVKHLLKGNDLRAFGLQTSIDNYIRNGEEWEWDGDKIRQKLIEDYGDRIQNAEIIGLREEIKILKERVEMYQRSRL